MKKQLTNYISIFAFFIITIVTVFATQRAVPFMMDDLWYATNLSVGDMQDSSTWVPLSGLGDVFESQVWHYLNWGGRSMTHTILQLTILCGEAFADILNTVVMMVLAYVIYVVAKELAGVKDKSVPSTILYIAMIIGALHGLNANWKMSMYWQAGSANYLYITIFILLFAWCYVRELGEEPAKPLNGINVWIVPLAILAGWSNENMGPTVWLISVFTILYLKKKKLPLKVWMILGSIFSLVGSAACILAPGNFARSAEAADNKGIIWKMFLRVYSEARGAFDYLFPAVLVTVILAAMYFGVMKKKVDLKSGTLFAAAIVACGAMILSPHFPDRATFGSLVFFLVVSISIVMRIIKENEKMKGWLIASGAFIWLHGMFFLAEYLGMSWGWII